MEEDHQPDQGDGDDDHEDEPPAWSGGAGPIGHAAWLLSSRPPGKLRRKFIETLCRPSNHIVSSSAVTYTSAVPRLWTQTIQAHRSQVRDAILDTAAALVAEHGLLSVSMSQIAERTGIGRATLYKYFPDVEAILLAWHQRQITDHLAQLAALRDQAGDPGRRLEAVLGAYALIAHDRLSHAHPGAEVAALLHRSAQVTRAQRQVHDLITDLLTEAAQTGQARDDIAPDELATYCVHALTAASTLPSKAAVRRLVAITLAGLRPQH
jgi:AcrR family transcriptional regulator